ncbi:MAG: protocatechuate 3,4-dioxygenase [Rhodanobacteraceae bacterium]
MQQKQLDRTHPIPDVIVFDLEESHKGYRLNRMCDSLKLEENRKAYKTDEEVYMERYRLTAEQKRLVRARDWAGLSRAGGNIYFLIKLGFVTGTGLYHIGAQMRGESFEAFMATRTGRGAR